MLLALSIATVLYAAGADTPNKRAMAGALIFAPPLPFPDGTIDANDREQMAGMYPLGSIADGGPSEPSDGDAGYRGDHIDGYRTTYRSRYRY